MLQIIGQNTQWKAFLLNTKGMRDFFVSKKFMYKVYFSVPCCPSIQRAWNHRRAQHQKVSNEASEEEESFRICVRETLSFLSTTLLLLASETPVSNFLSRLSCTF